MRFGAKGLMSTLMRVRISSDAPRCTVQFGALDPRCTMVQVHGDPNEPSLGAGAAGAPCVTLLFDGVNEGKTDLRSGNKYSVAQKLRAAEYSRIHGYDTDEKGTRPPRRPPAPAALAAVRHTRSAARLQAPTTRRSRATP